MYIETTTANEKSNLIHFVAESSKCYILKRYDSHPLKYIIERTKLCRIISVLHIKTISHRGYGSTCFNNYTASDLHGFY